MKESELINELTIRIAKLLEENFFESKEEFYSEYNPKLKKYEQLKANGEIEKARKFKETKLDIYSELTEALNKLESINKHEKVNNQIMTDVPNTKLPVDSNINFKSQVCNEESQTSHAFLTISSDEIQQSIQPELKLEDILPSYDFTKDDNEHYNDSQIELYDLVAKYNEILKTIPDCSEKSLFILWAYFDYEQKKEELYEHNLKLPSLFGKEKITVIFNLLKTQLEKEEVLDNTIKNSIISIEAQLDSNNISKHDIFEELVTIQEKIRTVDFDLLVKLVRQTDESAKKIKDLDIVLLLGATGSGKSTTIHFLAGSEMEETELGGFEHIAPKSYTNPDLANCISSPFMRSETRSIYPIKLNLNNKELHKAEQLEITLCDTPGFGDTAGVEMDLANGIGVANAVRSSRSVRIVVLFSKDSMGGRWEGVSSITNLMAMFLPNLEKHLPAFSYCFTKFEKKNARMIHSKTQSKKQNLRPEEKSNKNIMAMLDDILNKTRNSEDVIIIDPVNDSPQPLLSNFLSQPSIAEPQKYFEDYAATESLHKLKEQLTKTEASFQHAFKQGDIPLANYKFSQLLALKQHLRLPETEKTFQSAKSYAINRLDQLQKLLDTRLKRISQPHNQQMNKDMHAMKIEVQYLAQAELFRAKYLERDYSNLIELLEIKLKKFTSSLLAELLIEPELSNESTHWFESKSPVIISNFKKLKFISNVFSKLTADISTLSQLFLSGYQEAVAHWSKVNQDLALQARQALENQNYEFFVSIADELRVMRDSLRDYLKQEDLMLYEPLIKSLEEILHTNATTATTVVQQYLRSDIEKLKETGLIPVDTLGAPKQIFRVILDLRGIEKHINRLKWKQENDLILHAILDYTNDLTERYIPSLWNIGAENLFHCCHQVMINIHQLVADQSQESKLIESYKRLESLVFKNIQSLKEEVANDLSLLVETKLGTPHSIDFQLLNKKVNALQIASNVFSDWAQINVDWLHRVTSLLNEFISKSEHFLENYKWKPINIQGFRPLLIVIKQLNNLILIESALNKKAKIPDIVESTTKKINLLLKKAERLSGNLELAFNKQEQFLKILNALDACVQEGLDIIKSSAENQRKMLNQNIKDFFEKTEENLQLAYDEILLNSPDKKLDVHESTQYIRKTLQLFCQLNLIFSDQKDNFNKYEFIPKIKRLISSWFRSNGKIAKHLALLAESVQALRNGQYDPYIGVKIETANELKILDKYYESNENYTSRATQLETALKAQQQSKIHELSLLNLKKAYNKFVVLYKQIWDEQPDLHNKLIQVLNNSFDKLEAEVTNLTEELKTFEFEHYTAENLQEFLTRVTNLDQAQGLSSLPGATHKDRSHDIIKQITVGFKAKVEKFFDLISQHISNFQITEALSKIKHARQVSELFIINSDSTDEVTVNVYNVQGQQLDQKFTKARNKQLIQAKLSGGVIYALMTDLLNQNEQRIKKFIHTENTYYSNLPVEKYSEKPPVEYFKALEEFSAEDREFIAIKSNLRDQIIAKIKRILTECESDEVEFDVDQKLRLLKEIHPLIPLDIYSAYQEDWKKTEVIVKSKRDKQNKIVAEFLQAEDLKELVNTLMRTYDTATLKACSNAISTLMGEAFSRYNRSIEQGQVAEILFPLSKVWLGWLHYYYQLRDRPTLVTERRWGFFKKQRLEYLFDPEIPKRLINDMLTLVVDSCRYQLQSLDSNSVAFKKSPHGALQQHLDLLIELFKVHANYSKDVHALDQQYTMHLYLNLTQRSADLSVEKLLNKLHLLSEFMLQQQAEFDEFLASTDLNRLLPIFLRMEEYSNTQEKFKTWLKSPELPIEARKIGNKLEKCLTYSQMREKLAERVKQLEKTASQRILEHKRAKSANSYDRGQFYQEIASAYTALKNVQLLATQVDERIADVTNSGEIAGNTILLNLQEVAKAVEDTIERVPTFTEAEYVNLNTWYDNLRIAKEKFEVHNVSQDAALFIARLDKLLQIRLQVFKEDICNESCDQILIDALIQLKLMAVHAPTFKDNTENLIDKVLFLIKKQKGGVQRIAKLGIELNKRDDEYQAEAQMLIAENDAFKSYAIELRNEKTLRYGFDYVLEKLLNNKSNINIDVAQLKKYYENYEKKYWEIVEPGLLQIGKTKKSIIQEAKNISNNDAATDEKILSLMSNIFAYWTLMHSNNMHDVDDTDSETASTNKNYLLQPHAAQVVAIFRLLGIDVSEPDTLKNHLVEIGTGEGKSVTMAVTATVLALLGFDVDCACYSDYLSERDYNDFVDLFHAFGVSRHISYGTFNRLCENLINQRGELRDVVTQLISTGNTTKAMTKTVTRERIIIIDEVDVFFSTEFYGNFYRPLAEIRGDEVHQLVSYIWSIREDKAALRLNTVKSSKAYHACVSRYPGWETILEETVKAMIVDVQSFDGQEYVVIDDKIGYREQHGVSVDISYRYKTIYAYFHEHERGEITSSSRDAKVALLVDCGAFSYAEIPKQYKCIMGVTGTLSTLSPPEFNLLKSIYGIHKFTYMPSVYGDNQLEFSADSTQGVLISERVGHAMELTNEIKRRQIGDETIKRPVMVFFDSNESLENFYNSSELARSGIEREKIKLLTEDVNDDQKSGLIRQAVTEGMVTLISRGFGRGTDFKCYDDRINKRSGGVHVIQTFISDELSEETQIKGRTARQGERGSFSMVLILEELERYGLRSDDIEIMKKKSELYTRLNIARCVFFQQQYSESLRYVDEIKTDHDDAMEFLDALFRDDMNIIRDFLFKRNKASIMSSGSSRTIVLMDATGSMHSLLNKSKNTVEAMFERAYSILQEKNITSAFELQFVAYRNYDQHVEKLLQCSTWESEPINLRQFIASIAASGGTWMEEAVEIALWHVNHTAGNTHIDQAILIGDAPPNTRDLVSRGRNSYKGESYWQSTEHFKEPTFVDDQVTALVEKEIPVHAFHVHTAAATSFAKIAAATGGVSEALDINSSAGAERLTQLVTERILNNIGGASLIEAYREKYVKGYVSSGSPAKGGMFAKKREYSDKSSVQDAPSYS